MGSPPLLLLWTADPKVVRALESVAGEHGLTARRSDAAVTASVTSSGTTYATRRVSPGRSRRATTAARDTPAHPASAASTSPGSTRKPRIFT